MIPFYSIVIYCVVLNSLSAINNFDIIGHLNKEQHIEFDCGRPKLDSDTGDSKHKLSQGSARPVNSSDPWIANTIAPTTVREADPFKKYQKVLNHILFGPKIQDRDDEGSRQKIVLNFPRIPPEVAADALAQFPSGNIMRAELFMNKTSVHLPSSEYMHRGHLYLNRSKDFMQTALDAFAILLQGNLDDVLRLPRDYVLRSAQTIAMMHIAKEKLVATWTVVKGKRNPIEITPRTLEMYRPLFKYLNGNEIARLNLSDERILAYIGTHADLDRHQVGVVASAYIKLNKRWLEPRYLNLMNNLLCGVPMNFMRRAPENTYLQLTHQVFYHIRACDPLQRRFYYAMMTRTQALGKPYSWSARDVSRLGLLLSEVHGPDLATVNPEAMAGITAQVMLEIPAENLKYITDMQLRFIGHKPLNILARKLSKYQEEQKLIYNEGCRLKNFDLVTVLVIVVCLIK